MSVDNRTLTFIIVSAAIGVIAGVVSGIYLYDTPPDTLKECLFLVTPLVAVFFFTMIASFRSENRIWLYCSALSTGFTVAIFTTAMFVQ